MKYLIKKVKIVSPEKTLQRKDILIDKGIIIKMARSIVDPKAKEITGKNLHASIGFCDVGTQIGEPGYEERETISTLQKSAAKGGYTCIAPFPNLYPVIDSKSSIKFLKSEFDDSIISIFPIGAISKKTEGKEISEMIDMSNSGAIAFSDGQKSIQNTGIMLCALQYGKSINAMIIHTADDHALSSDTTMHEGAISTSLGLPGNPVESELIMVNRDLELAKYADSSICLHNISSEETVNQIKRSSKKQDGLFSSVASMNLLHTDNDLETFDPIFKVKPPLRSEKDRKSLIKALKNGTIHYIASNHTPIEPEHKDLEFFRSSFGASTLDTVFSSLNDGIGEELGLNLLIDKLAHGNRKMLNIPIPKIEEGATADLCIFDPTSIWKVEPSNIFSKSKNNPYIGRELKGQVIAVFNKNKTIIH